MAARSSEDESRRRRRPGGDGSSRDHSVPVASLTGHIVDRRVDRSDHLVCAGRFQAGGASTTFDAPPGQLQLRIVVENAADR